MTAFSALERMPYAAQNHALRKPGRAQVVAGAKLAQHGQQGIAHERVDLVDEQDQRLGIGLRQAGQHFLERTIGSEPLQDVQ